MPPKARGDQHAGHEGDRCQPPTRATSNQRGDHGAGHGEREHHRGRTRESGKDRGGRDRDRNDRSRWMHARTDEETERDPSENREQRNIRMLSQWMNPETKVIALPAENGMMGRSPSVTGTIASCRERERALASRLRTNADEPAHQTDKADDGERAVKLRPVR